MNYAFSKLKMLGMSHLQPKDNPKHAIMAALSTISLMVDQVLCRSELSRERGSQAVIISSNSVTPTRTVSWTGSFVLPRILFNPLTGEFISGKK